MLFENLLIDIDAALGSQGFDDEITLHVIGATALHLQVNYDRGTKDGDVLQVRSMDEEHVRLIVDLAGPGTRLHRKHGMYIDVVSPDIPMLPAEPLWHSDPQLVLENLAVRMLDVADVCVSKLYRWNTSDQEDVRRMLEMGALEHEVLVARFRKAIEHHQFEARADALPEMVERLHELERDVLLVEETHIDLPEWLDMT